jgi:cholesterol transport system auxiliary component
MRILKLFFLTMGITLLMGCSPVKLPVTKEFQLSSYSAKKFASGPRTATLLVTAPEAVAGYQTEQMRYIQKPFQIESFAKNAWISPPADMLYPLLVQSLQRTGYFYAIASSPYNEKTDYRLDTQLLTLVQNFIKKPSVLEFTAKLVLTRIDDNKVIASRIFSQQIPCPADTPYGGVVAANKATYQLTATAADFVISHIKRD